MFCNKCGTSLPDDSCFCSKCGNRLPVEELSNEHVADEQSVYDVILESYDKSKKVAIMKLLKETLDLPLQEVKNRLDSEPSIIMEEAVYAEAIWLKSKLDGQFGIKVEMEPMCAQRLSYQSEFEAICKAFDNMSPDNCIEVLVPRNKAIEQYIELKQGVLTGGFLSSASNMVFHKKDVKECNSFAPLATEEINRSKELMIQMLQKLNENYNNSYFTKSPEDAAEKMAEKIFLYINNLGDFERLV